jgi:hypothetical protein
MGVAEFALLMKVGMVIKGIVAGGYSLAGGYIVKTGVQYVQDYRESIERERSAK